MVTGPAGPGLARTESWGQRQGAGRGSFRAGEEGACHTAEAPVTWTVFPVSLMLSGRSDYLSLVKLSRMADKEKNPDTCAWGESEGEQRVRLAGRAPRLCEAQR